MACLCKCSTYAYILTEDYCFGVRMATFINRSGLLDSLNFDVS